MKKELFRIYKSKTSWIVLFIAIIVFFVFSINYALRANHYDNYIYHGVSEYKTIDEINEHIDRLEHNALLLDENDTVNKAYIEQTILIYKFLYENEISYSEFQTDYSVYMSMYEESENKIIYTEHMLNIVSCVCLLSTIVISVLIISNDFSSGLYKNVFGTNKLRKNIIKSKLYAYLIFFAFLEGVLLIFTLITSMQFDNTTSNVICFWGNNLFILKSNYYIIFNYISQLLGTIPFVALFFGIALMMKNTYLNITASVSAFAIPYALSLFTEVLGRDIYAVKMGLINALNGFYPSWIFILTYSVEVLVSIVFVILGIIIYKQRDL